MVGIEHTEFRKFIHDELMPQVRRRYRVTKETAIIIGESLAGLFIVETFFPQPKLLDTYSSSIGMRGARLQRGTMPLPARQAHGRPSACRAGRTAA